MSIEGGARAGMIAPDETTFEYLAGRATPQRRRVMRRLPWQSAFRHGATFDNEVVSTPTN
jgi:3-isopropylmalate/(R)-2-methylmalate dehydratase large subunit